MSDDLKTIKFQLMLSPAEAEAIDDWGFKNRIRTRAEAIRRLCQMAIIFDERRVPLVHAHVANIERAQSLLAPLKEVLSELGVTEDTQALTVGLFELTQKLTEEFYLLRLTTGIAKNLKGEGNFEHILADAKKLIEDWEERAKEWNVKPSDE